jgi:hypothetical protein
MESAGAATVIGIDLAPSDPSRAVERRLAAKISSKTRKSG